MSVSQSNSTVTIDSGAQLTDSGNWTNSSGYDSIVVAGSLAVTGNVIEYAYETEKLNGGSITVGGVKSATGVSYTFATYDITGGVYTVTGSVTAANYGSADTYNVSGGIYTVDGSVSGGTAELGNTYNVSGTGKVDIKGSIAENGDNFSTSGTGSIELDSVGVFADSSDYFNVESATSSIEVGNLGDGPSPVAPAAGSFTLDAATNLTDGGSITAPHIVINGTLEVGNGETLRLYGGTTPTYNSTLGRYVYTGGLTGNGTLQIDNNAQLTINDGVDSASQNAINFAGTGGTLSVAPTALTTSNVFLPAISGFNSSDRILYQGDATSVAFTPNAKLTGGALTLLNGTTTVATMTLTGNYAGDTFFSFDNNGTTQISVSTGGDTATAPAGTTTADQYVWSPNVAGSWDNAANWIDTTSGANPALVAPGQHELGGDCGGLRGDRRRDRDRQRRLADAGQCRDQNSAHPDPALDRVGFGLAVQQYRYD